MDNTKGNTVGVYDLHGNYIGTFGSNYNCQPTDVVVDSTEQHVYVSDGTCSGNILKFDPFGTLVATFAPIASDNVGPWWMDLSADDCTMYYTSDGPWVRTYNVCNGTQGPVFNAAPLTGGGALGIKILPGGVLVADHSDIVLLSNLGTVIRTFSAPPDNGFVDVAADPLDSNSFWASSFTTSEVYKFNLTTGAIEMVIDATEEGGDGTGI